MVKQGVEMSPGRKAPPLSPPRRPSRPQSGAAADSFLPDLCQASAVLLLVLVAELLAVVLAVSARGLRDFDWGQFAITSLYMQWVVLASAGGLCLLRRRLRGPRELIAAISYLWVLLVTACVSLVGQWLLRDPGTAGAWQPDGWALLSHLLISSVLAGIALRYFYLAQALRQREQAQLEAQVAALQARIRPHFLFNTMNSIASLIAVDPGAAEAAVEDLAALFRASLADTAVEVPLADELDLCRRYLRIEQWRLGERLRVSWRVDGVPQTLPIPALTLQPLVENAIYHGIQHRPEGGELVIEASYTAGEGVRKGDRTGGVLRLQVSNPLPASGSAVATGNRLALDNIGHRLRALYGEDASVSLEQLPDRFLATLVYRPGLDETPGGAAAAATGTQRAARSAAVRE